MRRIPIRHLTLNESLSALIREVTAHKVNKYPSKGDNCFVIKGSWMTRNFCPVQQYLGHVRMMGGK